MNKDNAHSQQSVPHITNIRPLIVWLLWLLIVCAAAAGLCRYRIDNALRNWAPSTAGHEAVATYAVIGGPRDLLEPEALANKLQTLDEVSACVTPDSINSLASFMRVQPGQMDSGGATFDDPNYTGLFCFAKSGVGDAELLHAVRDLLKDIYGTDADNLELGGAAVFTTALNDWSQRRLPMISALIIVSGALLLGWVVKSPSVVASATVAIVGSQIALVGFISWMHIPMDMVLSMTWPLMMALGYSFAAHRALRRGVTRTLALCALTTAGGIFGFVFCEFPPVRAFAAWGALGLILTWISVMLLVTPAQTLSSRSRQSTVRQHLAYRLACTWIYAHPRTIVILGLLILLSAGACLPQLSLQDDPIRYFPVTSRVYRDYEELDSRLVGMLPFETSITGLGMEDAHEDATTILTETPGVRLVADVSMIDPRSERAYLVLADGNSLGELVVAQPRWQAWAFEHGVELKWTGVAAQLHAVSVGVSRVAIIAFPIMVLIAGASVFIAGGYDWRIAMIGALVNLFPIAVLTLVITALGWRLSLPSLMIGAIAVGVATDDTLHIAADLKRVGDIRRVLLRCWRPCAGSSLIAATCLAMFVLSPFAPTAEFGLLMAVAILSALIGDMILLPAAVTLIRKNPPEPKQKEVH